jgi:triacylglycerol lipase
MAHRFFVCALVAFIAIGLGAAGCLPSAAEREQRCVALKADLDACTGTSAARLDCASLTDTDIDRLGSITQGNGCALLASAIPHDGDLNSGTCRVLGVGCLAALTPKPVRRSTRYPILLVNGIDSSPLFRYSNRIVTMIQDVGGHAVYLANLPAYQPPSVRGPELAQRVEEVLKATGASKVNLICHSLGGLDCRYLVSPNGLVKDRAAIHPTATGRSDYAAVVATISTIATAHRGTPVADVLLGYLADGDRGQRINQFATLVGDWFDARALEETSVKQALRALSVQSAPAWNAEIVDAAGVYYQSWAGVSRPFGQTTPEHERAAKLECQTTDGKDGTVEFGATDYLPLALIPFASIAGRPATGGAVPAGREATDAIPNDGLASVQSAKWGNFRGCIAADHQEQLGQRNIPDVNVRSRVDIARFYTNVAGELSERGY